MKYVEVKEGLETEIDSSEVIEILDSEIVDNKLQITCRTSDESCIRIKLDEKETLGLGKTFFMQAAKSLPEGMQEDFVRQLIG